MEQQSIPRGKDLSSQHELGDTAPYSGAAATPVFAQLHSSASVDAVTGLITTGILSMSGLLIFVDLTSVDVERVLAVVLVVFLSLLLVACCACIVLRAAANATSIASPSAPSAPASFLLHPLLATVMYLSAPFIVRDVNRSAKRFVVEETNIVECNVCLDPVCSGQHARALPCGHVYHSSCADAWVIFSRKNSCPLCSHPVCPNRDADMVPLPCERIRNAAGAEEKCK